MDLVRILIKLTDYYVVLARGAVLHAEWEVRITYSVRQAATTSLVSRSLDLFNHIFHSREAELTPNLFIVRLPEARTILGIL